MKNFGCEHACVMGTPEYSQSFSISFFHHFLYTTELSLLDYTCSYKFSSAMAVEVFIRIVAGEVK